ncbi:MAG: tannase/feruloyl esterase family alpha/beta hydrolase [Hyphomonadaceae bacterium]|nr:tannase/feruloyl esterase family alpha/beta hydrolase [Hyphomonadaceae bacterium]
MKRLLIMLAAACAGLGALAACSTRPATAAKAPAPQARTCNEMFNLTLAHARVDSVEEIAPGWDLPPSPFNVFSPTKKVDAAFCRVRLTVESEIKVEVWLPPSWNGRQLGVGNGGFSGAFDYPAMARNVAQGFAVSATDTGHETPTNVFDVSWMPGHRDRIENFAHRAHHLLAQTAREVITARYANAPHHAYFSGCSSGGWQGMTEAQRYPGDYDGVLAGAPAFNWVRLLANGVLGQQYTLQHPGAALSVEDDRLVQSAAVAACDMNDGVRDGLIENPRACRFDPARLQCRGAKRADCLTRAQVQRVRDSFGLRTSPGGQKLYPGPSWGSAPNIDWTGRPGITQGEDTFAHLAMRERPTWSYATFDADRDLPAMQADMGATFASFDPNLTAFRDRGGKLIVYHGWNDNLLSPENTLDYYAQAEATMGADVRSFARLFMVPGMEHCAGGPGPWMFDGLSALVAWVEQGEAPAHLIAAHPGPSGAPDRTRPLCPWPQIARYRGEGASDEAANFSCAAQ